MTSLMPDSRHGPNTVCEHLWVSDQMNSTPDSVLGPEQLMHDGVERVVGSDDHNIADPISVPLFVHLLRKSLQTVSFFHYKEKSRSSHIWKISK